MLDRAILQVPICQWHLIGFGTTELRLRPIFSSSSNLWPLSALASDLFLPFGHLSQGIFSLRTGGIDARMSGWQR